LGATRLGGAGTQGFQAAVQSGARNAQELGRLVKREARQSIVESELVDWLDGWHGKSTPFEKRL
jgi:hypothetical protein